MKYRPIVLLGLLLVFFDPALQSLQAASNDSMPKELEGVWITTKEENLEGRAGGEMLKAEQKTGLCSLLTKNPLASHSFEGVVVLRGVHMITWDGRCTVYGGFKRSDGGKYVTSWKCKGEHGTNGGKVIFELQQKNDKLRLVETTIFKQGGSFKNVYDEKCDQ